MIATSRRIKWHTKPPINRINKTVQQLYSKLQYIHEACVRAHTLIQLTIPSARYLHIHSSSVKQSMHSDTDLQGESNKNRSNECFSFGSSSANEMRFRSVILAIAKREN